ncbi:MAG: hypothetical protein DLM72_06470 [Candidatus Nitrosopolaris wilkensis]|nr:MAG: hypothetical protein DLM72_06470 [Candidatus Nitrosopolaris wilkensis]
MSQISSDKTSQETSNQWAEITGQIIDKLIGKNMSMTYDFQNLIIDIPKAEGPGGKHMGSVQWTINGKVTITSEAYDKNNQGKK